MTQGGVNFGAAVVRVPRPSPANQLGQAISRATDFLLRRQSREGYWVGELEADSSLESDYILLQLWLYPPGGEGVWKPPTLDRVQAAARYILQRQLPGGGWNLYPGGPANINCSVKAYLALRLSGLEASDARLEAARCEVLRLGGVEATNSYTKVYLSYFGLWDRAKTPAIPPELFLLPKEGRFSIYEMSSWTRAILAPLAILSARRASRPLPADIGIGELFSGTEAPRPELFSWRTLFTYVDGGLKLWERRGSRRARAKAVRAASEWMIEHFRDGDGLGAIFPAMMNSIMALSELGYGLDHPLLKREIDKFGELIIEENGFLRLQPCLSPVWDTALSGYAIGAANPFLDESQRTALARAADWLLKKEAHKYGDWAVRNKRSTPGGWYFEFSNPLYPDCDDTAKVLLALQYARATDTPAQSAAEQRAVNWLLGMQSKDGGWAAFDVDNDAQFLNHLPFADHNAMLDPACADITGRVLEALSAVGFAPTHTAVIRGVAYLKQTQQADGSWYGRWGVNYIYGTCFALRGLRAAGEDPREAYVIRAGEWLRSIQNADGGWGESCRSYDEPSRKGEGESTASQTAWALMGLFAGGDHASGSVEAGIGYLLDSQNAEGSWDEEQATGTGFPSVFYLRYHLYRHYFPLIAMGEYARVNGVG